MQKVLIIVIMYLFREMYHVVAIFVNQPFVFSTFVSTRTYYFECFSHNFH